MGLGLLLRVLELEVNPELFMDRECLSRGLFARELLDGPALHLLDYQADPYAGGSLAMGLAAVPFFALLGDGVFSLHLATLPFLAATALATWALVRHHLDPRAALLALALVLLPPYPASRLALVAWGDSVQVPLFMALTLLLAAPLAQGLSRSPWRAGLLGLAAGAGLSWHYHSAIPLALLVALLLLGDRAWLRLPGPVAALLGGTALGLSPWLAYNLSHRWEGLIISTYGSVGAVGDGIAARYPGRLLALAFPIPAASLGPGPASWPWALALSVLAWLAVLGAAGFLAWRLRRDLRVHGRLGRGWGALYLLAYLPFFVLAAAATPFSFENLPTWYFADRYLSSLHWVALVLVSLAAARLWARGGRLRVVGGVLAALFLGIGVASQGVILLGHPPHGPLVARDSGGRWLPGYDWNLLADDRVAFGFYRGDPEPPLVVIQAAEHPRRAILGRALGMSMVWRDGPDLTALAAVGGRLDPPTREAFWQGVGAGVGRWRSHELPSLLPRLQDLPQQSPILRGLEPTLRWWFAGDEAKTAAFLVESVAPARLGRFFEQLGQELGSSSKRDLARALERAQAAVPEPWLPPVLEGICRGQAPGEGERLAAVAAVQASSLPPALWPHLMACTGEGSQPARRPAEEKESRDAP